MVNLPATEPWKSAPGQGQPRQSHDMRDVLGSYSGCFSLSDPTRMGGYGIWPTLGGFLPPQLGRWTATVRSLQNRTASPWPSIRSWRSPAICRIIVLIGSPPGSHGGWSTACFPPAADPRRP